MNADGAENDYPPIDRDEVYQKIFEQVEYRLVFSTGLIPLAMGAAAYFGWFPRYQAWRPLWIGFPIGFVGTTAVYYFASSSV